MRRFELAELLAQLGSLQVGSKVLVMMVMQEFGLVELGCQFVDDHTNSVNLHNLQHLRLAHSFQ